MTKEPPFTKYDEQGAYHWLATYPEKWYQRSPRINARYDLPLKLVAEYMDLHQSLGLDIGCGDGVMLYKMRQSGARAIGVEPERSGLLLAVEELARRGERSTPLLEASGYQLPFRADSFDFVTALEIVEHLHYPEELMVEISRVLRPGGVFVCTTPNRAKGQLPDVVRDSFHVHEFIPSELVEMLSVQFNKVAVWGMWPEWLDQLYVNGWRCRFLAKGIRYLVKGISLFYNPFQMHKANPDSCLQLLVSVAQRD